MHITAETAQKIAHLSRLELTAEEAEKAAQDLTAVANWMSQLNLLDTTDVEPLIHLTEQTNALRDDVSSPGIGVQAALSNAPKKDSDYFRVPKVIE